MSNHYVCLDRAVYNHMWFSCGTADGDPEVRDESLLKSGLFFYICNVMSLYQSLPGSLKLSTLSRNWCSAGSPSYTMCAMSTRGKRGGKPTVASILNSALSRQGKKSGSQESVHPSGYCPALLKTKGSSQTFNKCLSSCTLVRKSTP